MTSSAAGSSERPRFRRVAPEVPASDAVIPQAWLAFHASRRHASTGPAGFAQAPRGFLGPCSCRHAADSVAGCALPGTDKLCLAESWLRTVAPSRDRLEDCRSSAIRAAVQGVHPRVLPRPPLPRAPEDSGRISRWPSAASRVPHPVREGAPIQRTRRLRSPPQLCRVLPTS